MSVPERDKDLLIEILQRRLETAQQTIRQMNETIRQLKEKEQVKYIPLHKPGFEG